MRHDDENGGVVVIVVVMVSLVDDTNTVERISKQYSFRVVHPIEGFGTIGCFDRPKCNLKRWTALK
jgi:hypothetical protein